MLFDPDLWDRLMIYIGEATVLILVGLTVTAIILGAIAFYSISHGKFYFPRLLKSGLVMLEGTVRAICKLLGVDDKELMLFFIKLNNMMNSKHFSEIPADKRAIFLPQCLRSTQCPANLTPEGLKCRRCGQCTIGASAVHLEDLGYTVFIVPGSSFIKRMVKQYHPKGIIGVGCLMEVKEGLELCDRFGLIGMGIVTLKDGCVETVVNWQDVFELAVQGLDPASVPDDLHVFTD